MIQWHFGIAIEQESRIVIVIPNTISREVVALGSGMCFVSHKLNHCSASYPIELRITRYASAQPIYLRGIRQFVQFDILGKDRFGSEDEIYFVV